MTELSLPVPAIETRPLGPEQAAWSEAQPASLVVEITGPLDEARLRAALTQVAGRYDALGTAFVSVQGFRGLRQQPLAQAAPPTWTAIDLRGRADAAEAAARHLAEQRAVPFELAEGRCLRALLLRLDAGCRQLAVTASPLVADRGSLGLLYRALRGAYDGTAAAEEPLPYAYYLEWRREIAADEDAAAGRAYWQDHLDAAPPPLLLPFRRRAGGGRGSLETTLEPAVAGRLSALAAGDGGLESLLQAAWWALLARIAGQRELLVGWQHDCRRDYEVFAGCFGVFDKILPLRLSADPEQSFAHWHEALQERLARHRDWQEHGPLAAPGGDAPLRAGFLLASDAALRQGEAGWCVVSLPEPQAFELALRVELDAAGRPVGLALHYDAGRYGRPAMQTLLEQYHALLQGLPETRETPLGRLSPLGPAERARLQAFDAAEAAPAVGPSLSAAVARWARETPAAPAVAAEGLTLDYAALDARAERLAAWLRARGVGEESVVALELPRSPALVVALLAVWRAGGCYLPLDPQWPAARRRQLLELARPVLRLGATHVAEAEAAATAADLSKSLPPERPERAAYLLFTSGSSGTPKGVVVEHRQLASYVAAASEALGLAGCRRFALTATVAADLGNTLLFGALATGGCLVIAGEADMGEGAAFAAFLRRQQVDCAKLVPSHLAALLDCESPAVPRCLILGGEPAPRALVERVLAIEPDCRLFNHYGPTETTVGVLVHAHDPRAPAERAWAGDGLPLTRVLAGNEVWLLDEAGAPVPCGALGELYIGGAQLCRGYLGQAPEPEAGPFVAHPFRPGRRLYRSGDLGRYLPDGGLQLVGRADQQLKLRGYRVEPGEVETVLAGLEGVREAAVVAWRPECGEPQLVAYVTPTAGPETAGERESALRAALAECLPEVMLPARLFLLEALPRLANGKIDRRGLPDPAALLAGQEKLAPRDELERLLQAIVAELLERPAAEIGVGDDLFALGGHSLLVIRLVARLRQELGLTLPPGLVFDHPTVVALAEALRRQGDPEQLEQRAGLRLALAALSPEERAALLAEAPAAVPQ